jgi:hypothetical protein
MHFRITASYNLKLLISLIFSAIRNVFFPVQCMRMQEQHTEIKSDKIPVNTIINHYVSGKKKTIQNKCSILDHWLEKQVASLACVSYAWLMFVFYRFLILIII